MMRLDAVKHCLHTLNQAHHLNAKLHISPKPLAFLTPPLSSPQLPFYQSFKSRRTAPALCTSSDSHTTHVEPCVAPVVSSEMIDETHEKKEEVSEQGKFVAAMGLIVGTAVGPGILGLPAATLRAGLLPSTIAILASWVYVIASILLVAELTFGMMAEENVEEVSFTGLAIHTLGHTSGRIVAIIYAMLNYALLVACIAGLGSIMQKWMPFLPSPMHSLLCPLIVVALILWSSFKVIDRANQALCAIMLVSLACLLALGTCLSEGSFFGAWAIGQWSANALLPAIPVMVLTLGFHVITPVVCKIIGNLRETRRAILTAALVPLMMVLAWNTVVLGLAKSSSHTNKFDPLGLILSMSSFVAPAVQAFAFSALGTTLIGYALSFPRQLSDTMALFRVPARGIRKGSMPPSEGKGKEGKNTHTHMAAEVGGNYDSNVSEFSGHSSKNNSMRVLFLAIGPPALMSILHPDAFTRALDFAGVYANCFLFGFLPPVMAWRHHYGAARRAAGEIRPTVPGARYLLAVLIAVSLFLGFVVPFKA